MYALILCCFLGSTETALTDDSMAVKIKLQLKQLQFTSDMSMTAKKVIVLPKQAVTGRQTDIEMK